MILAVGPTTPAARACNVSGRRRFIHDSDSSTGSDMDPDQFDEDSDDDDDDGGDSSDNRSAVNDLSRNPDSSETMQEDENQSDEESTPSEQEAPGAEASSDESLSQSVDTGSVQSTMDMRHAFTAPSASQRSWVPVIRHESCINTACWLDVPWRLSLNSAKLPTTVETWEASTQIITSGDDHMVKFWDVRHAMGSISPTTGGWDVFSPFATADFPASTNMTSSHVESKNQMPSGAVIPLATVVSGHLGNVFHVTPVPSTPGLVLTCAADGQLRSCHVERNQSSNLIMRPMVPSDEDSDSDDYYMMHMGMAYSHQLLTASTGLLCSDRGLFRFDMRVSPRDQARRPFKLIPSKRHGWRSYASSIKACAVWSPSLGTDQARKNHFVDSNYVFAGGSGEEVHMFDLRMETSGEGSSRVVERYRPRILKDSDNVSVCGLDVSKDGRELLVSYESDQIYTFPIFNKASSPSGPTLEEIDDWSGCYLNDPDEAVSDLSSYGAHLNRFTFLKSAKYAGPNDEYICTGSDSGHAWVYCKSNGTVASLLSADSHVCNGVVPHPTLPIFITYGIDSTAKIWRATMPVDPDSNDSGDHRALVSRSRPYQMSPVVKNPEQVQQRCSIFEEASTDMVVFPDYIPTTQEVLCGGRFMPTMLWTMVGGHNGAPRIGNALRTLPYVLRSNRYECCRAVKADRDGPIEGPLENLAQRLSRMRLQHQADQNGLVIDSDSHPYLMRLPKILGEKPPHPADMVPDFPSDWILWDPAMNQNPHSVFPNFTLNKYPTVESREKALVDFLLAKSSTGPSPNTLSRYPWLQRHGKGGDDDYWWPLNSGSDLDELLEERQEGSSTLSVEACEFSRKVLYYTALLCKNGGNEAMKEQQFEVAARRYDKAIQYCCVAFFSYEGGSVHVPHLTAGMSERLCPENEETSRKTGYVYAWCPLLRVWISSHLNLALVFLKPDLWRFHAESRNQAEIALRLLSPYTQEPGKVYYQNRLIREHEPETTYQEAMRLQAKAYFRLGSAELELGDFFNATKALEASMASTDGPADPVILKKLNKAKSRSSSQKKRNRRRFEVALASGNGTSA